MDIRLSQYTYMSENHGFSLPLKYTVFNKIKHTMLKVCYKIVQIIQNKIYSQFVKISDLNIDNLKRNAFMNSSTLQIHK